MHKFYETVSLFYFLRNQWEQALFKRVPNVQSNRRCAASSRSVLLTAGLGVAGECDKP
jgi:hypothetical protein